MGEMFGLGVVPLIGSCRLYRDVRKGGLVGFGLGLMTKPLSSYTLNVYAIYT